MICDRCFKSLDEGEHGQYKCPYEARPAACGVIGDDIPGGVLIHNGLCNDDGTPRRYDTKSSMKAEADRRGLTRAPMHVGTPGSDKSPFTSRWF